MNLLFLDLSEDFWVIGSEVDSLHIDRLGHAELFVILVHSLHVLFHWVESSLCAHLVSASNVHPKKQ